MFTAATQPTPDRKKQRQHNGRPIAKDSRTPPRPYSARLLITIRVQTTPETKLPRTPAKAAKTSKSKARKAKEQKDGANKTQRKMNQRLRGGGATLLSGEFSRLSSFPQFGQLPPE
jgi:hypothetical protein